MDMFTLIVAFLLVVPLLTPGIKTLKRSLSGERFMLGEGIGSIASALLVQIMLFFYYSVVAMNAPKSSMSDFGDVLVPGMMVAVPLLCLLVTWSIHSQTGKPLNILLAIAGSYMLSAGFSFFIFLCGVAILNIPLS